MRTSDLNLNLTRLQGEALEKLGFKGPEIGDILGKTICMQIGNDTPRTIFALITSIEHEKDKDKKASLNLGIHVPHISDALLIPGASVSYQGIEIDIHGKPYLRYQNGKVGQDETKFSIGTFEAPVTSG